MSYKVLQLSPHASTRISFASRAPWNRQVSRDIDFLRAWFEDDSDLDLSIVCDRTNWNAIAGLAFTIAVSASFWAGIGWVIARVWA